MPSSTKKPSTPTVNFDAPFRKRVMPWSQKKVNGSTLEFKALNCPPAANDLSAFESLKWRPRQLILARLGLLEKKVSLKAMPAILALVTIAAAIVGLTLSNEEKKPSAPVVTVAGNVVSITTAPASSSNYAVLLFGATIFVLIAAIIVLLAVRQHNHREACLNAWTEAFKDSHSYKTKAEETGVGRTSWVRKVLGLDT